MCLPMCFFLLVKKMVLKRPQHIIGQNYITHSYLVQLLARRVGHHDRLGAIMIHPEAGLSRHLNSIGLFKEGWRGKKVVG